MSDNPTPNETVPAVDPNPASQEVRPPVADPAAAASEPPVFVEDPNEKYIGYKTETGMVWPRVNLGGGDYTRPGSTISLVKPYFAVLSGSDIIDQQMINQLKEHVRVNLVPKEQPADKPVEADTPVYPALSVQPQGNVSPRVPDASKRK